LVLSALGWMAHRFDSQQCKIFLFPTTSRPNLELTQPLIQWVLGDIKWQGSEADHLAPNSTRVKKVGDMPSLASISSWHSA
jgi:hypothetical protein